MPVQATVATTIANTRSSSSGSVPRSIESTISDRSKSWTAPTTTIAANTTRLSSDSRSTSLKRWAETPWKFIHATHAIVAAESSTATAPSSAGPQKAAR